MHGRTRSGDSRWLVLGAAAISALAVALTGCGGGSSAAGTRPPSAPAASAAGSSGNSDPCQVVTVAEASHLVGKTLKKVSDAKLTCTYTGRSSLVAVTVRRLPNSARSKAEKYYQQAVREFSNVRGVIVTHPGVGDKSVGGSINLSGDKLAVVVFLKGATYVAIQANPDPGPAAMKTAAMTALRRL